MRSREDMLNDIQEGISNGTMNGMDIMNGITGIISHDDAIINNINSNNGANNGSGNNVTVDVGELRIGGVKHLYQSMQGMILVSPKPRDACEV